MKKPFNRVSVIGLGYIGLPTAAVIANRGIDVIGVDINKHAVDTINKGQIHIVEPELDVAVSGAVNSGKLRATTVPEKADAFLIAVPTPFKENHQPDLAYIKAATAAIAPVLEPENLIILESTSPVGTTEQIVAWLRDLRPDLKFPSVGTESDNNVYVAYCPERVLPGQVLRELVENDRVIGGVTKRCAQRAQSLYKQFVAGDCIISDAATAEMVKLTENAFRDCNIAFANELSLICDDLGINVWQLIELANRHPRVNILQPGAGVGGHCIAVDPWFIVAKSPDQARLIRTAREVNDSKPHYVRARILEKVRKFKEPVVACLGLAFKPNIDDLRESPAMEIVASLTSESSIGKLLVVEPNIEELPAKLKGKSVEFVSLEKALATADVVAVLVRHEPFRKIDQGVLREKIVLDFVDALARR